MVKKLFLALATSLFSLYAAPVDIHVEVDSDTASAGQPISGRIIIRHSDKDPVDESSFTHENQRLPVQLVSQGTQSSVSIVNGRKQESHQTISCYWFEVPGHEEGSHKLSSITVKVGDQICKSDTVPYHIYEASTHNSFQLRGGVDGPTEVFPGQRIRVYYRLFLGTPVEETRIHLPLLNPEGFRKLGDVKVQQYRRGNSHVVEYSQELEAKVAGDYQVEESFIEGLAYQEDFFSRRIYKKPKLKAACPPIQLKVQSFPTEEKPASFEGAIGAFTLNAELISSNEVCVGDKVEVELTFKGEGIETLKMPNFSKQKELSQHFRFSDLPPSGKQEGYQKKYVLELRPLNASIDQVPALEFSFFNPKTKKYETLKTKPIALNIKPLERPVSEKVTHAKKEEVLLQDIFVEKEPALINISKVYPLSGAQEPAKNLKINPTILFLLIGLLGLQWIIKKQLETKKGSKNTSYSILKESFKYSKELQKYHLLLEKALQMRLIEKGLLDEFKPTEDLEDKGINREVKNFLNQVQHELFSGQEQFNFKKSQKMARKIYRAIEGGAQ